MSEASATARGPGQPIHAVALALAVDADGPLFGVLIVGAAGAGKSLLALRAIEACPWSRTALIADDAVFLSCADERLMAAAAPDMAGLIEVRGFGPVRTRLAPALPVRLGLDLDGRSARMPDPLSLSGYLAAQCPAAAACAQAIPLYPFDAEAPAASARLRAMARQLATGQSIDGIARQ